MEIIQLPMGMVSANTYVIKKNTKAIVIDPASNIPSDISKIVSALKGFELSAILITHAHFDHISGVDALVDLYSVPVYVPKLESSWLSEPNLNLSILSPKTVSIKTIPIEINSNSLRIDEFIFEVIETPGHTNGSLSFKIDNDVFVGDFIFKNSVGRTDLPTGNMDVLMNSIRNFIDRFKNQSLTLFPGHGSITTLETELLYNPYLQDR